MGMIRAAVFACLAPGLAPGLAAAHPHIFVDARVEVVISPEGLEAVRLTWIYDEFFSLLVTEDMGLDEDLDGTLTPPELEELAAYVLAWPEGYGGDLTVSVGGEPVALGARRETGFDFVEGRMVETHLREVRAPLDGPVTIRVFDPGYYTAYTVETPVTVTGGEGCEARIARADILAATDMVEELLYAMPQDEAEDFFPEVGEAFADTITVTCAGSS
ncbi:MAG: ABC-type uncharacterized transport system, periplasmic component [Rhodobacteraceae bacterium HLUCCA08]|nr:MAG: ABC-type uncharacterized transport system, periplasmic component [Rhodobacteraceae bacterium HLUCCA08]